MRDHYLEIFSLEWLNKLLWVTSCCSGRTIMIFYALFHYMWLNISKGASCLSYRVCSQNIWNYGPKVNFKIHIFWNPSCLKDLTQTAFLGNNGLFNYYCEPILCPDPQTLRALFSKSTFHRSELINEITISWKHNVWFQTFLHQHWIKGTVI